MSQLNEIVVLSVGQNEALQNQIRLCLTREDVAYKPLKFQILPALADATGYLQAGGNVVLLVLLEDETIFAELQQLSEVYELLPIIGVAVDNRPETITKALTAGLSWTMLAQHVSGALLRQKIIVAFRQLKVVHDAYQQKLLAEVFSDSGLALHASLNQADIFERLLDQIEALVNFQSASVFAVSDGWLSITQHRGYNIASTSEISGIRMQIASIRPFLDAMRNNGCLIIDTRADPTWVRTSIGSDIRSWLCVPIYVQNQLIAFFSLDHNKPNFFSYQDLHNLRSLANIASLALENSTLFSKMQASLDELRIIQQISLVTEQATNRDELLSSVTALLSDIVPGPHYGFLLRDTTQRYLVAHQSFQGAVWLPQLYSLNTPPFREMFQSGRPYISRDYKGLYVPLTGETEMPGVLAVLADEKHSFRFEDAQLFVAIASQVSNGLARLNLLQAETARRLWAEQLQLVTNELTQFHDIENIWQNLLAQLYKLIGYEHSWLVRTAGDAVQLLDERHPGIEATLPKALTAQAQAFINQVKLSVTLQLHHSERSINGDVVPFSWIGTPIFLNEELVAILVLARHQDQAYTQLQAEQLNEFANQVALALQNALLFASRQRRIDELTVLSQLAQIIANAESEQDLLAQSTRLVGQSLYSHNFGFLLFDESLSQLTIHNSYQMSDSTSVPHHLPLEGTVTGYVAKTGRSLRIDDTASSNVYYQGDPTTRSEICVPIQIGQEIIGVLNAESPLAAAFTADDERILNTLADQLGTGLQRLRLLESERINKATTEHIRQASLSLTQNLDTQALLQQILAELQKVVAFDSASIVKHQQDYAEIIAVSGLPTTIIGKRFAKNSPQVMEMSQTGRPVYIPDVTNDRRFESWAPELHFRSWVGVPLYSRRELFGHLTVDCARVDAFSPTQIHQIEAFASHAAIALENARYYAAEQHSRQIESTIREAIQAFTQVLDSDTIFELLLAYLERLIPYHTANVMLLADDNRIELKCLRGYDEATEQVLRKQLYLSVEAHPAISKLLINGESLLLPNVRDVPYWQVHEATRYINSWLGIPLVSQGIVLGCFQLDHDEAGFYTEEHRLIAEALAGPAAAALRNVYLLETAQHARIQLQTSQSITALLNSQSEVFDLLPAVLKQLEEIAGARRITYLSREGQMLRQIATTRDIKSNILDAPFPMEHLGKLANAFKGVDLFVKDIRSLAAAPILKMLTRNGIHAVLAIPIQLGQEVVSLVAMGWDDAADYDSRQLPFFRQVASALGLAVARSRLHLATRRQANEQALLNEITREFAHQLDPVQYYVSIVHALRKHLGYDYVGLLELERDLDTLVLKAHSGLYSTLQNKKEHDPQLLEQLHLQALQQQTPQLISDVARQPALARLSKLNIRSALVMPIQSGSEPFGVLSMLAPQVEAFSASDITLLTAVIDQLTMALDKVFLFEQTQQRTDELSAITDFSSAMRNASTSEEILNLLVEQILVKLNADLLTIFQSPAGPHEKPFTWRSRRNPIAGDCVVGGDDSQIMNRVFTSGDYCLAPHLPTDELFQPAAPAEMAGVPRLHTAVYFPLKTTSRSLGLLRLGWIRQHPISSTDIRLLTAFVEIASTAMERALVLTTLEDRVTERTRQLEEANERLQDLDRLKSKFVSDVTHELRTPITNMGLYMELLATGKPEKRSKYTDVLSRQIERLGTLVQDILSLSRLDMGKIDIATFRDFALNKLVEQSSALAIARATEAGLNIEFQLGEELPTAYGEPNQMAEVVNNLLDNAVMYTTSGTILVRTWADEVNGQTHLYLSVTDNGDGIPEEELPLIFDRFYRGTNAGQTAIPGSGLGLAIVKEIVDLHKGVVTVTNNPSRGCTFTVCFPASQALPVAA